MDIGELWISFTYACAVHFELGNFTGHRGSELPVTVRKPPLQLNIKAYYIEKSHAGARHNDTCGILGEVWAALALRPDQAAGDQACRTRQAHRNASLIDSPA